MRPLVPAAGRAAFAATLIAALLAAGCGSLREPPEETVPCGLASGELPALPLETYRGGASGDASAPQGVVALMQPEQIAASGDDLFIADQGLGQLVRVQRSTQRYATVARLPGRVSGLFVDPFRKLYMAVPSVSAVLQVSPQGATERVFRDADNLGSPMDVAVDRMQNLHVADGSDARVIVFDRLGQQVGALGERLDAPNPFATTNAVAVGQRGVYVLDGTARRLHLFSHARESVSVELAAVARAPGALAVDRWDRVFILDHAPERVLVLTDIMAAAPAVVSNLGVTQPILDLWVDEMGTLFLSEPGAVRSYRLPAPCKD